MFMSTASPRRTRNGHGFDVGRYRVSQHRNNIADTIELIFSASGVKFVYLCKNVYWKL